MPNGYGMSRTRKRWLSSRRFLNDCRSQSKRRLSAGHKSLSPVATLNEGLCLGLWRSQDERYRTRSQENGRGLSSSKKHRQVIDGLGSVASTGQIHNQKQSCTIRKQAKLIRAKLTSRVSKGMREEKIMIFFSASQADCFSDQLPE